MPREARDTEANVHAALDDAVRPNCELAPVWRRDPLDGRDIARVLDLLAQRRGLGAVRAAVARWLREVR